MEEEYERKKNYKCDKLNDNKERNKQKKLKKKKKKYKGKRREQQKKEKKRKEENYVGKELEIVKIKRTREKN